MKAVLGKVAFATKNGAIRSNGFTTKNGAIRSNRTYFTLNKSQNHKFLTLGVVGSVMLLTSSSLTTSLQNVAKSEQAAKNEIEGKTRPKGERIRKKKKKKKRKKISRITNPGKFSEESNVHKETLHGFRPFTGGQFHFEFPFVEEPAKVFKVNVSMLSEKAPPSGGDKQHAELCTELVLGKDCVMTGKLAKGLIEGRWNQNFKQALFNKKFSTSTSFYNSTRLSTMSVENHMKGKDYTVSLGYECRQQDHTMNTVSLGYLQSIAPKLSLGCKCMHTLNQMTDLHFMAQYKNLKGKNNDKEGNIVTIFGAPNYQENRGIVSVGYTKMFKPGMSLVTEISTQQVPPGNPTGKAYVSQCLAGCRYAGNTFQYHCVVDSSGTIAANLIQVNSFGAQLTFSGSMNHWAGQSNFGIGLKFVPNTQPR